MSEWNEQQFDRVAGSLDGEQVQLTDTERELNDDFTRSESALGDFIETPLPPHALQRASRRLLAAIRGLRMWKRVRMAFMSGVSAAAMIVISLGLANLMATGSIIPEYDALAWLFDGPHSQEVWQMPEQDPEVMLLAADLDEIETAMFRPEPVPVPIESPHVDDFDQELDEFWRMWLEEPWNDPDVLFDVMSGGQREV